MKISKKQEAEVLKVYKTYFDFYIKGDVNGIAELLDADYNQIGSAESEVFFNKNDAVKFLVDTIDQIAGKSNIKNRTLKVEPLDDYMLVTDLFDIYVLDEKNWVFYSKFRASTLMREKEGKWKIVHQHSSIPDSNAEEGDNIAIEKISEENRELRDAIKRRTVELEQKNQELEIESALERVRSRSMGMQKSEELEEVIQVVYEQFVQLNIQIEHAGFIMDYKANDDMNIWLADQHGVPSRVTIPYFDTAHWNSFIEAKEKGEDFFSNKLTFKEKNSFYKKLLKYIPGLPDEAKEFYLTCPGLAISTVLLDNIGLYIENFKGIPYSDEENNTLMRFGKVFQQTYTRFLDLKKAEAQAREAQIEASLERVRSKSMAMHKSKDIGETVSTLFSELLKLGIHKTSRSGIGILDDSKYMKLWSGITNSAGEIDLHTGLLDMTITPLLKKIKRAWKRQNKHFYYELEGEELYDYYDSINNSIEYSLEIDLNKLPEKETADIFSFKHGIIYSFNNIPIPEEAKLIFKRFAKVFEQTYTRFLDIQKAEMQAREAQIETALERVRSRSMAMHKSDELADLSFELVKQVQALGVPTWFCAFNIYDGDQKSSLEWGSNAEGTYPSYRTPREGVFLRYYEAGQRGETFLINNIGENECAAHYVYLCSLPGVGDQLLKMRDVGIPFPTSQIDHVAYFKYGYILFITFEPAHEAHEVFKRFAKVFEQTYTRFLDLQKAEKQAREAQIEAALEKVRSRTMAMQQSEELPEAANNLFLQVQALGIPAWSAGYCIFDKYKKTASCNMSSEGVIQKSFTLPSIGEGYDFYKPLKRGEAFHVDELGGEALVKHYEFMRTLPIVGEIFDGFKKAGIALPTFQIWHIVYFPKGYLMFITYEPVPDAHDIFKRFAKVFDQTYTRFLDLQKAEKQTRTAQINLAVERVRAKALAMHQSEEIMGVVAKLKDEVMNLDIPDVIAATIFLNEGDDNIRMWDLSSLEKMDDGYQISTDIILKLKKTDPHLYIKRVWENQENYFVETQDEKGFKRILELIREHDKTQEADDLEAFIKSTKLERLYHAAKKLNNGKLCIDLLNPPSDEMETILTKMGAAFDLAYKRFEDLQKAEQQAREAQIETSLERVRSSTMAMHKSEDLLVSANLLYTELKTLGFTQYFTCGFVIVDEEIRVQHVWVTDMDGEIFENFKLPLTGDPVLQLRYEKWKQKVPVFYQQVGGAKLKKHLAFVIPHFGSEEAEDMVANQFPDPTYFYMANFSHGYLHIVGDTKLTDEEEELLARFMRVFEQTYQRFLDLKKAEEQAMEALVEAAMERIRSRVTAMKVSADLLDIVVTMRTEFTKLGHEAHYFWHMRWLPDTYEKAMTSGDGTRIGTVMELPRHIHGNIKLLDEWEKGDEPTVVYAMDVETAVDYVDKMITLGDFIQVDPNAPGPDDIRHIGGLTFIMARTTHGEIGYSLPGEVAKPPAEGLATLVRFAKAFDLAYKRFEDLKKTERQMREVQIEVALERVRARALAMQEPEELKDVAQVLRHEMGALGIEELETSSIYIHDKESDKAECWYALKDVRKSKNKLVSDHFVLNLKDTWVGKQMLKFYNSNKKQTSIIMKGVHRKEWIDMCEKLSTPFRGYYGDVIPDRTYHLYKFSDGAIGVATPGDISTENWDLIKRTAAVFSLAYSRFNDLTKARIDLKRLKTEKQRAEEALTELKSTQSQLIQSEKMASLGELTAGIAHEIQNPLNFVNNFSEVSQELIDEMNEEITKGEFEEAKDIAADVKQNLDKIYHHGKRAEAIVKGMLQHSRSSSGEKEPTDINALADEYLRLAYHGLRAKNKSFNATMKSDYDENIGSINIIPQDIGRVILNLITNAFYAVNEKNNQQIENYQPTVSVSTKKIDHKVIISVADNGNGIPQNVVDKIFQPFFTTKPTGQGTGLGLSMSYDIITKGHGGELKVETLPAGVAGKEDEGTTFIIEIPD